MACTVCNGKHKLAIDALLREGQHIRVVAKQFDLGKDVVFRHKKNCLKPQAETAAGLFGESLARLKELYEEAKSSYRKARQRGDLRATTVLLGQLDALDVRLHAREARLATQTVNIRVVDENGVPQDLTTPRPPNEAELLRALSQIYGLPFIGKGDKPEHESVLVARLIQLVADLKWEVALETTLRSCKGRMSPEQTAATVTFLEELDRLERGNDVR
jgi:hypothetical protein